MTIKALYPSISPSLMLDFANTKALDPRVSFVRTTTAAYYDGKSVAKAEENLLLQSQDFTTTWDNTGTTDTANTTTAPDGTLTADTLKENSETNTHLCFQSASTSGVVTLSVFAKLGAGTRFLTIGVSRDTTNCASATFDFSGGTSTQTQANGTYSSASATITAVAESFYRCTLTVTTDSVSQIRIGLNNTGTPTTSNRGFGATYTGDDTSSIIIWGAQLEQRSAVTAYTPTTTQPITNYIPVLLTAASGVARFDHNPTTGESLGLLIEEQRTNLLTYSEAFDDAVWGKVRGNVIPNTIVAPDGTLTGDKFFEDTQTGAHHINIVSQSYTSGVAYTLSGFYKAGERPRVRLGLGNGGAPFPNSGDHFATFDLISGLIVAQGSSITRASITPVGNGWFRCSITATAQATGTDSVFFGFLLLAGSTTTTTYTGDGYSGLFYWGAQLEAGAFPTSYIPTVAATVTRNADLATMTGTNFSSWFGGAPEGSFYSEATSFGLVGTGAGDRRHYFSVGSGAGVVASDFLFSAGVTNGVVQISRAYSDTITTTAGSGVTTLTNGQSVKYAISYNASTIFRATNSVSGTNIVRQVNSGAFILLAIGAQTDGIRLLNGTMKKLAFYPKALTAAELQALTS
jgi:cyclophilin family peptidyl-prolyl cis-trans isomerase